MTLVALGVSLDGIGHVIAEQTAVRIVGEKIERLLGFSGGEHAAKRVERRAVPEILLAGLGRQTVGGPESRREKCVDGAASAVVDPHRERNADPRAQMV